MSWASKGLNSGHFCLGERWFSERVGKRANSILNDTPLSALAGQLISYLWPSSCTVILFFGEWLSPTSLYCLCTKLTLITQESHSNLLLEKKCLILSHFSLYSLIKGVLLTFLIHEAVPYKWLGLSIGLIDVLFLAYSKVMYPKSGYFPSLSLSFLVHKINNVYFWTWENWTVERIKLRIQMSWLVP